MLPKGLFQDLTRLTSVVLKTGTVVIGEDAFNGASALTTVKENATSETTTTGLIISSTLEMIITNAFKGSGIPSVSFVDTTDTANNSLWFIGQGAFQNATALTTVDLTKADTATEHSNISVLAFNSSNTATGTSSGTGLYSISSNSFNGATSLVTIKLPTSTATIYGSAFVNNTALNSVNFSDLTKLGNILSNNFTGANALSSIDFSNASTTNFSTNISTAENIFTGLPTAATVNLPAAVNSLNDTSFLIGSATSASTTSRAKLVYPNGVNLNITTSNSIVSIGSGSGTTPTGASANTILQYVSGTLDLTTTGSTIQRYYGYTFFGNPNLTSLTMSASGLSSTSGSDNVQSTTLFMNRTTGSANTVNYQYSFLPFGNNTSLTNFIFKNFDVTTESLLAGENVNPLHKTTTKT